LSVPCSLGPVHAAERVAPPVGSRS
jgi:hypothetical protein